MTCPFSVVGSWACRVERNIPLQGLALPCMGSAASHFSGTSQPTPFPEPDPREVTVFLFSTVFPDLLNTHPQTLTVSQTPQAFSYPVLPS